MGARAGCAREGPPVPQCRVMSRPLSRSILRRLCLEPRPGLWPRSVDRFVEWPPAGGGSAKGEGVVQGQKWSPSADLEDLGRLNAKEPEGKSRAQLGEWAVGVGNFSLRVAVCASGRAELRKS